MPDLDTLVSDVYNLFDPSIAHDVSEENINDFCSGLKSILVDRLGGGRVSSGGLRFSSLGRPDRQAWYDNHPIDGGKEQLLNKVYLKFLYGDVIEQLLLFLIKEAGHVVEKEQEEVCVDGVKGHIDCVVDGVVVDIKSASPFGYKKFRDGTVTEDDPFGYVDQLAGYASVLTPGEDAAWIAMDKVSGDICVSKLSKTVIKHHQPAPRIAHLKEVLAGEEPPPFCYDVVPDGVSGNMKLGTACSYCPHKFRCRPELRGFAYSGGPRYLTVVAKEPNVPEISNLYDMPSGDVGT